MAAHVPILTYHAVVDAARPTPLAVSPADFAAQMTALAQAGYRAVSLLELADALRHGLPERLPERAAVITFDDGYRSVLAALPILREHGFTAAVFLVTDAIGGEAGKRAEQNWRPPWPLLSWGEVETLAADGFQLGAHTLTHPVLPHLPPAEAEREMVESRDEIARRTGREVRAFAYPYGARSAAVEALARRHFDLACGASLGLAGPGSNPFDLVRVDAYYLTPARLAGTLETLQARAYLAVRQALRRVRRLVWPDWRTLDYPTPQRESGETQMGR
jgi:peptidoglycan/xylan/chitin deacetylase (PgdA/CDA1 family)